MSEVIIKKHNISNLAYVVEMSLKKGYHGFTHSHKFDHLSMLLKGHVKIKTGEVELEYKAPCVIEIEKESNHEVTVLDDITWACIHSIDEPDRSSS